MRKRIQMRAPVHLTCRLEEDLYEKIIIAAELAGVSVSAFVRNTIKREILVTRDESSLNEKTNT